MERIVAGWSDRTVSAVAGRHVLAIQDTTDASIATRPRRRRASANGGTATPYGVLAHAMLAVDAVGDACLGLLGGTVWNRNTPVKTPPRKRLLTARESRGWVETAEAAKPVLARAVMVTFVSGREGDIHPTWSRVPGVDCHVLNRVMSDRRLIGEKAGTTPHTVAARFRRADTRVIALPARFPDQAARDARVEIHLRAVEIARPVNEKDKTVAASVRLRVVEVKEINPPKGVEALHWRLLTTHDVANAAAAWQIVDWYKARWTIEQLFRVMKSQGFGLEDSQLHTAEGLVRLAAVAAKAACVDMQLVQERDGKHGLAATTVFTDPEIETIEALSPTLERKTARQQNPHRQNPHRPGSLARAC